MRSADRSTCPCETTNCRISRYPWMSCARDIASCTNPMRAAGSPSRRRVSTEAGASWKRSASCERKWVSPMSGPMLADVELNRKAQPALDRTSTRQRTEDAPKAIWVTWERHRRTHELCRSLGVELFELTSSASAIIRYPYLIVETFLCLARQRPALLFIQCPSILLGLWAGLLKYVFGYKLIADLHNEA